MAASTQLLLLIVFFLVPYLWLRQPGAVFAPDRYFSDTVKGLATVLILYHHVVVWNPKAFWFLPLGGDAFFGVSLFYFISGVGLKKSYDRNRYTVRGYLSKRALAIFPMVALCMLARHAVHPVLSGKPQSLAVVDLLGLGDWFVASILVWYVLFLVIVKLARDAVESVLATLAAALSVWVALYLLRDVSTTPGLWSRFPFSFALGVLAADRLDRVLALIFRKPALYSLLGLVPFGLAICAGTHNNFIAYGVLDAASVLVCLCLLAWLYRFNLTSRLLPFLGALSLPLYLLQLSLLKYGTVLTAWRADMPGVLACILLTLGLAMVVRQVLRLLTAAASRLARARPWAGGSVPAEEPARKP